MTAMTLSCTNTHTLMKTDEPIAGIPKVSDKDDNR
jgi:hypothetical protein